MKKGRAGTMCQSARGPNADLRRNVLIGFTLVGSTSGAYSHFWSLRMLEISLKIGITDQSPEFSHNLAGKRATRPPSDSAAKALAKPDAPG